MKAKEPEPIFISQREAAKQLGIAPGTVFRWVRAGLLPVAVVNGVKRIRGDLLDAWIDERTDPGKAPKR